MDRTNEVPNKEEAMTKNVKSLTSRGYQSQANVNGQCGMHRAPIDHFYSHENLPSELPKFFANNEKASTKHYDQHRTIEIPSENITGGYLEDPRLRHYKNLPCSSVGPDFPVPSFPTVSPNLPVSFPTTQKSDEPQWYENKKLLEVLSRFKPY